MLKKTVKYEDYDGNQREEDLYFNLNESELIKFQMKQAGGMDKYTNRIVQQLDGNAMIDLFEEIILMAYGEKSDDGKHFRKNEEVRNNFKDTEAFNQIYLELCSDEKKFADFFIGCAPKDKQQSLREAYNRQELFLKESE